MFKAVFVRLDEMEAVYTKITELLSDKKNVALTSDRAYLQRMLDKPRTEQNLFGRCTVHERDFVNTLQRDLEKWLNHPKQLAKKKKQAKKQPTPAIQH